LRWGFEFKIRFTLPRFLGWPANFALILYRIANHNHNAAMSSNRYLRSLSLALLLLTTSWQAFATDAPPMAPSAVPTTLSATSFTALSSTAVTTAPAAATVPSTEQAAAQTTIPATQTTATTPAATETPAPASNPVQALSLSISETFSRSTKALPARAVFILDKLGHYTEHAQEIVKTGFAYLGVNYHRGGTTAETGFDCSGLVRKVYDDAFGVDLPHNARAISRSGAKVSVRNLKPGDLVFFNTLRKTFSHVGIYVGNNLFLHAPSAGSSVRLDDLRERYWVKHFNGARRIETD
jgi:cell wall-associated NlpC family hydrolase